MFFEKFGSGLSDEDRAQQDLLKQGPIDDSATAVLDALQFSSFFQNFALQEQKEVQFITKRIGKIALMASDSNIIVGILEKAGYGLPEKHAGGGGASSLVAAAAASTDPTAMDVDALSMWLPMELLAPNKGSGAGNLRMPEPVGTALLQDEETMLVLKERLQNPLTTLSDAEATRLYNSGVGDAEQTADLLYETARLVRVQLCRLLNAAIVAAKDVVLVGSESAGSSSDEDDTEDKEGQDSTALRTKQRDLVFALLASCTAVELPPCAPVMSSFVKSLRAESGWSCFDSVVDNLRTMVLNSPASARLVVETITSFAVDGSEGTPTDFSKPHAGTLLMSIADEITWAACPPESEGYSCIGALLAHLGSSTAVAGAYITELVKLSCDPTVEEKVGCYSGAMKTIDAGRRIMKLRQVIMGKGTQAAIVEASRNVGGFAAANTEGKRSVGGRALRTQQLLSLITVIRSLVKVVRFSKNPQALTDAKTNLRRLCAEELRPLLEEIPSRSALVLTSIALVGVREIVEDLVTEATRGGAWSMKKDTRDLCTTCLVEDIKLPSLLETWCRELVSGGNELGNNGLLGHGVEPLTRVLLGFEIPLGEAAWSLIARCEKEASEKDEKENGEASAEEDQHLMPATLSREDFPNFTKCWLMVPGGMQEVLEVGIKGKLGPPVTDLAKASIDKVAGVVDEADTEPIKTTTTTKSSLSSMVAPVVPTTSKFVTRIIDHTNDCLNDESKDVESDDSSSSSDDDPLDGFSPPPLNPPSIDGETATATTSGSNTSLFDNMMMGSSPPPSEQQDLPVPSYMRKSQESSPVSVSAPSEFSQIPSTTQPPASDDTSSSGYSQQNGSSSTAGALSLFDSIKTPPSAQTAQEQQKDATVAKTSTEPTSNLSLFDTVTTAALRERTTVQAASKPNATPSPSATNTSLFEDLLKISPAQAKGTNTTTAAPNSGPSAPTDQVQTPSTAAPKGHRPVIPKALDRPAVGEGNKSVGGASSITSLFESLEKDKKKKEPSPSPSSSVQSRHVEPRQLGENLPRQPPAPMANPTNQLPQVGSSAMQQPWTSTPPPAATNNGSSPTTLFHTAPPSFAPTTPAAPSGTGSGNGSMDDFFGTISTPKGPVSASSSSSSSSSPAGNTNNNSSPSSQQPLSLFQQ